jgi:hypothetical protein
MLHKVALGSDHYSTSCIASHCAVVSVVLSRYGTHCRNLLCYFAPGRAYTSLVHLHDAYHMYGIFSPGFPSLLESIYVQERIIEEMMPEATRLSRGTWFRRRRTQRSGTATSRFLRIPFRTRPFFCCGMCSCLKVWICSSLWRSPSYGFIEV